MCPAYAYVAYRICEPPSIKVHAREGRLSLSLAVFHTQAANIFAPVSKMVSALRARSFRNYRLLPASRAPFQAWPQQAQGAGPEEARGDGCATPSRRQPRASTPPAVLGPAPQHWPAREPSVGDGTLRDWPCLPREVGLTAQGVGPALARGQSSEWGRGSISPRGSPVWRPRGCSDF